MWSERDRFKVKIYDSIIGSDVARDASRWSKSFNNYAVWAIFDSAFDLNNKSQFGQELKITLIWTHAPLKFIVQIGATVQLILQIVYIFELI